MRKAEQIARLALARASRAAVVIVTTNDQALTVRLLRAIDPSAVLTVFGADGVRVHGRKWGQRVQKQAAA